MIPLHLAGPEATGIHLNEPIAQFEIGEFRNFVYLILDWPSRKAVIIDPQALLAEPLQALAAFGFELTAIYLTHTHFDHVAGLPALARAYPNLPVYVHADDLHRLKPPPKRLNPLTDGMVLQIGETRLRAIHTPGHSAGETTFFLETSPPYLLTGDTLFIRDCGRTDFADGSNSQMFASLQKIKALPKNTLILPGHHYAKECASTLSQELETSPPLLCASVTELEALP